MKIIKMPIIRSITKPFVTIEVKNPTKDPTPVINDCLSPVRENNSSAITAPRNGPIKIPATGMMNGPISNPIVLPHIPAFEPPNFFTPTTFASVSAPNNKMTKSTWIIQKIHPMSSNDTIHPYSRNPPTIKKTEGIIG